MRAAIRIDNTIWTIGFNDAFPVLQRRWVRDASTQDIAAPGNRLGLPCRAALVHRQSAICATRHVPALPGLPEGLWSGSSGTLSRLTPTGPQWQTRHLPCLSCAAIVASNHWRLVASRPACHCLSRCNSRLPEACRAGGVRPLTQSVWAVGRKMIALTSTSSGWPMANVAMRA